MERDFCFFKRTTTGRDSQAPRHRRLGERDRKRMRGEEAKRAAPRGFQVVYDTYTCITHVPIEEIKVASWEVRAHPGAGSFGVCISICQIKTRWWFWSP
jgi:hypothetical protein